MRTGGLTLSLTNLGQGTVMLDPPSEALLPRELRVSGPATPRTENCRLVNNLAQPRLGSIAFRTFVGASPVNGLFLAHFDDGVTEAIRGDSTTVRYDDGVTWTSLVGGQTGTANDTWAFAMVRLAGGVTKANQLIFCNGVNDVYKYTGGGTAATTMASVAAKLRGAKALIGHRGRGLYFNVIDLTLAGTPRKFQRVYYSIVGNPETLTGTGSGVLDLDDDAFPIVNAVKIGGNICVFKGDAVGGSIAVGTPTGVVQSPYRWDTIDTDGIGLLCPRTLTQVTPDLYFFVGHDGFYLYDGGRGLLPVANESTLTLVPRITPTSLTLAHSYYDAGQHEIHLFLPLDGAVYPTEEWVFNVRERRLYGPYLYGTPITAATPFATTGTLTWTSLGVYGTWTNLPFSTWSSMLGSASGRTIVIGTSGGATRHIDGSATTDAGAPIGATYYTAAIAPGDLTSATGKPLDSHTTLVLQDVHVIFKNVGSWVPTVGVSTDGGMTWLNISTGGSVGGGTSIGRIVTKTYTTVLPGTWFQVRVSNGNSNNMQIWGLRLEFSIAGSGQANV